MKKKKIICIMGETASGKDTIAKYITKILGIKQVVSYTTRPMRSNEQNGREHWFISKEEMAEIKKNQHMFAYTCIEDKTRSNVDGYEYCTTLESLTEDVFIYIIDPNGVEYMRSNDDIMNNIELLVLYVYVPYEEREMRAKSSRSDFEKFEIRNKQESAQFEKARNEKAYDVLVENMNFDSACKTALDAVINFI